MNILITNDDGITSGGIVRLAEAARAFGSVTVIAPETQCSALSHCITLREPIDFRPHAFPVPGVTAWACSGTPADCVRIARKHLLDPLPDVVLSGINDSYNIGSDVQYSATVGAAMEAAQAGILSIALSEHADENHETTDAWLPRVLAELLKRQPVRNEILNVNFPFQTCRGILTGRTLSAASLFRDHYEVEQELEGGGFRFSVKGFHNTEAEEGSDFRAVLDHYVSIGSVRNLG